MHKKANIRDHKTLTKNYQPTGNISKENRKNKEIIRKKSEKTKTNKKKIHKHFLGEWLSWKFLDNFCTK